MTRFPKKIWLVDSFTLNAYRGNPAAVMIVDDFPENMPQIAAEMNLSETGFIKPLAPSRFHIRWFTPTVEVMLCGHGTLAAAHILFQENRIQGDRIRFESLSGPLEVYRAQEASDSSALILNFPLQPLLEILDLQTSAPMYSQALNLKPSQIIEIIRSQDKRVIVVLENSASVRDLNPDFDKISQIEDVLSVIVTAQGGILGTGVPKDSNVPYKNYDFVSRVFSPRVGINEDPVTGSAHCKLADYWMKRLSKTEFFAYQASRRGGEIQLNVQGDRVFLKGNAVTIMVGTWFN